MDDTLDDYDFTPSASSNLASLFGNSSPVSEDSSLIYTAPKQPKPRPTSDVKNEQTKPESSVICARVVQVWKLTNGKYATMGKLGFAIIGSAVQGYEIILYKEKRNVIMRVRITPNYEISFEKEDFLSFYDNKQENWLIKFNNNEDCISVVNTVEKYGAKIKFEKKETIITEKKESDEDVDNKTKADILSRIAKMGQSILPNKDVDEVPDTTQVHEVKEQQIATPVSTLSTTQIFQPPIQVQSVPNSFVVGQPVVYDPLNFLYAENRANHSEVRLNLSQISDKLNKIMNLVESNRSNSNSSNWDGLKSRIKVLELRNENLERELNSVHKENIKLKQQVRDCAKEKQSTVELERAKKEEGRKIEDLEREVSSYKDNIQTLSVTVEKQKSELEKLKNEKIAKVCEDKQEQTENMKNQDKEEQKEKVVAKLKDAMNDMYGNIMVNFHIEQQYENSQINQIIAQNIKSTSLKLIQNIQDILNQPDSTMFIDQL